MKTEPEATREAMRISYDHHYRLAASGEISAPGTSAEELALYGAMASRFRAAVGGAQLAPQVEPVIWADILPFMRLSRTEAREALAEYAVYKERPAEARITWLTELVQRACRLAETKENFQGLLLFARQNELAWLLLLDDRGEEYHWG